MTTSNGAIEGVVETRSDTGIKVDGEWYSVSKFKPLELPAAGAHVRLVADDKRFLRSLEVLEDGLSNIAQATLTSSRDRQIARLSVLKSAAAFAASREEIKSADVLTIAERWLTWVES